MVHVPRAGSVYVGGSVERPGSFLLRGKTTAQQAIFAAGGIGGAIQGGVVDGAFAVSLALSGGEGKTVIEIDAPRDRELQAGEIISLQPRRYRIFAAQD